MTPDKFTIKETFLEVSGGHTLYIQDWGNLKAALPIIFLHGGPGGGVKDRHKGGFDPSRHRVIFFDQRGCGKSMPYGSLEHNTTQDLISDISSIADHLSVKQFILCGGSWGATLALAYGIAQPKRVAGMVLNGIFAGSQSEIDWLGNGGFKHFFPEVWQKYLDLTPKQHHASPTAYHITQALSDDPAAAKQSCYAYENLEGAAIQLDDRFTPGNFEEYDPTAIRIEMSYMKHGCYMPDNYILDNAAKLKMPIRLVQGRYDMVCPPVTAYELDAKLPDSRLYMTINGHKAEHEAGNIIGILIDELTSTLD